MATLAGNLDKIRSIVEHCYPGIEVGWIGNAAHQAEASDHNPDSRGIVHAVDLMFENDTNFHAGAPATLAWLLTPGVRGSLKYVIHDRGIWSVGSGWQRRNYDQPGSDPHTNHIHVSGRHGLVGKNSETGTGYNTAAEHMTPAGSPCATSHPSVPVAPEEDMQLTDPINLPAGFSTKTTTVGGLLQFLASAALTTRNNVAAELKATDPDALAAAIAARLPAGSADIAAIKTALTEVLDSATLDVSVPTG